MLTVGSRVRVEPNKYMPEALTGTVRELTTNAGRPVAIVCLVNGKKEREWVSKRQSKKTHVIFCDPDRLTLL